MLDTHKTPHPTFVAGLSHFLTLGPDLSCKMEILRLATQYLQNGSSQIGLSDNKV